MTETGLPFRVTISGLRRPAFIVVNLALLRLCVNLCTLLDKLLRLLLSSHPQRYLLIDLLLRRVLAHVLRDLHGAEVRAVHSLTGFSRFINSNHSVAG